jgi:hypothetical protein
MHCLTCSPPYFSVAITINKFTVATKQLSKWWLQLNQDIYHIIQIQMYFKNPLKKNEIFTRHSCLVHPIIWVNSFEWSMQIIMSWTSSIIWDICNSSWSSRPFVKSPHCGNKKNQCAIVIHPCTKCQWYTTNNFAVNSKAFSNCWNFLFAVAIPIQFVSDRF